MLFRTVSPVIQQKTEIWIWCFTQSFLTSKSAHVTQHITFRVTENVYSCSAVNDVQIAVIIFCLFKCSPINDLTFACLSKPNERKSNLFWNNHNSSHINLSTSDHLFWNKNKQNHWSNYLLKALLLNKKLQEPAWFSTAQTFCSHRFLSPFTYGKSSLSTIVH